MKILKHLLNGWVYSLEDHDYKLIEWRSDDVAQLRTPLGYEILLTDTGNGIEFANITGSDEPVMYEYDEFNKFVRDMSEAELA